MRVSRKLATDQDTIKRFLDVFGNAMIILSSNPLANPGFFVSAHGFIHGYVEEGFFKKEDLLIKALRDSGFPDDTGPIGALRTDQDGSREAAEQLMGAAKQWQTGDDSARTDVGWAASEYSSIMRKHLERLKNLIFPLLEQNIPLEEEHALAASFDTIISEASGQEDFDKLVQSLEEELNDWR